LLTTGMHGTEHCIQERRTFRLSAPRTPCCRQPDHNFQAHRSLSFSWTGSDARSRFSLPRNRCPSRDCDSGIKVPSLLLRRHCPTRSLPVRPFCSTAWNRFAPVKAASTLLARCSSLGWLHRLRSQFPLPFGIVESRRIEAFHWPRRRPTRLPNPPDLRSLPTAVLFL